MGDKSGISWTDASWNPVTGCSHVSPGCKNCYAENLSLRMGWSKKPWTAQNAKENVILHPERLSQPLRWKKPRRIFVNSMSDLFHEEIPFEFIDRVFDVMVRAPHHIFQVLTKRPERMREYMLSRRGDDLPDTFYRLAGAAPSWPPSNVWLGTSVEDQRRADERIPILLDTPAAVRFLSCEPLLGPIIFSSAKWNIEAGKDCGGGCLYAFYSDPAHRAISALSGIAWVIVGGESGSGFRPMELGWARSIRDQCIKASVAFFFKQISALRPGQGEDALGRVCHEYPQ